MLEIWNIWFGISGTKLLKNAGKSTKHFMITHLIFSGNKNVPEKVPERNKLKAVVNLMTLPFFELLPGLTVIAMIEGVSVDKLKYIWWCAV